jgi:hypothetical protein
VPSNAPPQAVLPAPIRAATVKERCRVYEGLSHLANISYRVGWTLHFAAAGYTVRGNVEATRLFRREYRKPFAVPEKV